MWLFTIAYPSLLGGSTRYFTIKDGLRILALGILVLRWLLKTRKRNMVFRMHQWICIAGKIYETIVFTPKKRIKKLEVFRQHVPCHFLLLGFQQSVGNPHELWEMGIPPCLLLHVALICRLNRWAKWLPHGFPHQPQLATSMDVYRVYLSWWWRQMSMVYSISQQQAMRPYLRTAPRSGRAPSLLWLPSPSVWLPPAVNLLNRYKGFTTSAILWLQRRCRKFQDDGNPNNQFEHIRVSSRSLSFAARFIKTCPTKWSWAQGKARQMSWFYPNFQGKWNIPYWNIPKSQRYISNERDPRDPFIDPLQIRWAMLEGSVGFLAHEIPIRHSQLCSAHDTNLAHTRLGLWTQGLQYKCSLG